MLPERPASRRINPQIGPPPIAEALGRGERLKPPDLHEVLTGRLDAAQVEAEHFSNPRGFAPTPTAAVLIAVIETTDQMPEHSGNDRGFKATRDEAYRLARHRHPAAIVGDGLVHREEVAEVLDAPQVGWGCSKREGITGPGEQSQPFQAEEGGPGRECSAGPRTKSGNAGSGVVWNLDRVDLASSRRASRAPQTKIGNP